MSTPTFITPTSLSAYAPQADKTSRHTHLFDLAFRTKDVVYKGNWSVGIFKGTFTHSDHSTWTGIILDDKLWDGQGTYISQHGVKRVGSWQKGIFWGVQFEPSGKTTCYSIGVYLIPRNSSLI